jgi:hypothetical protein
LFIFLNFFIHQKIFFLYISSDVPQRPVYGKVKSAGGKSTRVCRRTVDWGVAGFEPGTAEHQSGAVSMSYHISADKLCTLLETRESNTAVSSKLGSQTFAIFLKLWSQSSAVFFETRESNSMVSLKQGVKFCVVHETW